MVVAIIALGPEKLPHAVMEVARVFKALKRTIGDAKESLEDQINIDEVKRDMDSYQRHIEYTKNEIMNNDSLTKEEALQAIDNIEDIEDIEDHDTKRIDEKSAEELSSQNRPTTNSTT